MHKRLVEGGISTIHTILVSHSIRITPVEFENYGLLVFDVTNKTVNGCAIKHGTFEKKLGRT